MRYSPVLFTFLFLSSFANADDTTVSDNDIGVESRCPMINEIECTVTNDACYGTFTYCATYEQCKAARCAARFCPCVNGRHTKICMDDCVRGAPQVADEVEGIGDY